VEVYKVLCGSHLHRTENENSDLDIRSVHLDTIRQKLSPFHREKVKEGGDDTLSFELGHFVRLLAKNNPTVMEIAFSDLMIPTHLNDTSALTVQKDIRNMAKCLLDTIMYTKACNGFIQGLLQQRQQTPKRLHHAARMATHLDIYLKTGKLVYNTKRYDNREDLLRIKRGEMTYPEDMFFKREPDTIWDTQDLASAENMCYNMYMSFGQGER
jgi:predicted nucleotidyltransferase